MSADEYELELVRQKYFKLEEQAKGNAEQLAIIEEAKTNEIAVIEKKAAEKSLNEARAVAAQKDSYTTTRFRRSFTRSSTN